VRTLILPGTEISTSVLGFGCAHLLRVSGARQRRRLLDAAYEAGIRHFDVAPMYGLGAAERELGTFAQGRRDQLVVATKFGIEPGQAAKRLTVLQGPARRVIHSFPPLRRFLRSRARSLYAPRRYDATAARTSLEASLRALNTDYVDLLLLHEPSPDEVPVDEIAAYFERERDAGRIRAWGLAGEPEPIVRVARAFGAAVPVLQVRDDVLLRPRAIRLNVQARITYGALSTALGVIVSHVTADACRHRRWNEAVGADCGDPDSAASMLLRYALANNPSGVVLFSTTRPSRIAVAASAASVDAVPRESLEAFLRLVDAELRPQQPAAVGP
jgi:D-threo-aldose 1-dehydrogenase